MGVNGLHKVLKSLSLDYEKNLKVTDLAYSIVGIDTSFWIYQLCIAVRGQYGGDMTNADGEIISHLYPLFARIKYMKRNNITPIFVFDGKPPELKLGTLHKRKEGKEHASNKLLSVENDIEKLEHDNAKDILDSELCQSNLIKNQMIKRSTSITPAQFTEVKEMLSLFGIQYIDASGEADVELAKLQETGEIDYIISDDTDILVFGGTSIVRGFSISKNSATIVSREVLTVMGIDTNKLAIISVLLGTDYNDKVPRIGPKTILNNINNNTLNLEDILTQYNQSDRLVELTHVIEYYLSDHVLSKQIKNVLSSKQDIEYYLHNRLGISIEKIPQIIKLWH